VAEQKPRDMVHQNDNLVIQCMDHRFHPFVRDHLAEEHNIDLDRTDQLTDAGASKQVVEGEFADRSILAKRLHDVKNVFIYDHLDCGAFGGLEAFDNDEQKEMEAHVQSQARAREAISKVLPQMLVRTFVINMDGEVIKL
jgi:hypothetical protein